MGSTADSPLEYSFLLSQPLNTSTPIIKKAALQLTPVKMTESGDESSSYIKLKKLSHALHTDSTTHTPKKERIKHIKPEIISSDEDSYTSSKDVLPTSRSSSENHVLPASYSSSEDESENSNNQKPSRIVPASIVRPGELSVHDTSDGKIIDPPASVQQLVSYYEGFSKHSPIFDKTGDALEEDERGLLSKSVYTLDSTSIAISSKASASPASDKPSQDLYVVDDANDSIVSSIQPIIDESFTKSPALKKPHIDLFDKDGVGTKGPELAINQRIDMTALASLHKAISEVPENVVTETPSGLLIELMLHQKYALTWLLWRERQSPPGGILADDMGLGKTLSMISLIVYKKVQRSKATIPDPLIEKYRRKFITESGLVNSQTTLVLAPASLVSHWEKEVKTYVKKGLLSTYLYQGPKGKREDDPRMLARYDIVIATYDLITSELTHKRSIRTGHSVLTKIAWERVILDEAHRIKNRNSLISKSCCCFPSVNRWCLTGTPLQNDLWDFYSLIRFLRVHPFSYENEWREYIVGNTKKNNERLNMLVKCLLLRRTKNQECHITKKPLVELKPKNEEIIKLNLEGAEKHCYDIMFEVSKQKVWRLLSDHDDIHTRLRQRKPTQTNLKNPFLVGTMQTQYGQNFNQNQGQIMTCILVYLLRLRQACVHMALTRHSIDLDAFRDDDNNDPVPKSDESENILEKSMAQLSLIEDEFTGNDSLASTSRGDEVEAIFKDDFLSAKLAVLLDRLDEITEAGDKCVVVSQWTSMLDIVEKHIKKKKVSYTSITGKVLPVDRQPRVDSFNRIGSGPTIMLLSLAAGGVGLNLVGGNHLFLLDLHWNPALEQQASDRIYRLGQKKNVFIHKIMCQSTVEERVNHIQENKKNLAKAVLEGATSKNMKKLTMNDLKFLFGLDNRGPALPQPVKPVQFPTVGTKQGSQPGIFPKQFSAGISSTNNQSSGGVFL